MTFFNSFYNESGNIKGTKAGRQWLIPKDTVYPDDQRVKTGAYRNWRSKKSIVRQKPALIKRLSDMCALLGSIYGRSLDRIILYGSYARGEQTEDSDVDIALVVSNRVSDVKHEKMLDVVVDFELELELTLSVIQVDMSNYLEWRNTLPFYKNIDREGVILWKADRS